MLTHNQDTNAPRQKQTWGDLEHNLSILLKINNDRKIDDYDHNLVNAKGDLIDQYRITRLINDGGTSLVYLGNSILDGSRAAIKVSKHLIEDEGQYGGWFANEVKLSRMVKSDYFPRYISSGVHSQRNYIAFEHIAGTDLFGAMYEAKRKGVMPTKQFIVRLFLKTLYALSDLHKFNIVHNDIKPGNILLTNSGDVYLCDLGIAKYVNDKSEMDENYAVGTAGYISPEQWKGGPIDGRSDIYGLGLVMLEIYYGILPNHRISKEIGVHPKFNIEILDVIARPGGHLTLAQIIRRCLQWEADMRYQSAQEVIQDLERIM
jgi:eukaryotic-like serine/threonine-protein kinase